MRAEGRGEEERREQAVVNKMGKVYVLIPTP